MSVMKLPETALIWKEIIFPFQIFKDIPFQFSTLHNHNSLSSKDEPVKPGFIMHLFTQWEYEKFWSLIYECVCIFVRMMQLFLLLIIKVTNEICTLRGVSVCISSLQRKGLFFHRTAVLITCVENPNQCCHWHNDNCVHMNRGLRLNKDIAFGLADENVNESFRTFSVYSCRERVCAYTVGSEADW